MWPRDQPSAFRERMRIVRHILLVAIIATVVAWVVTLSRSVICAHPRVVIYLAGGGLHIVHDSSLAASFCKIEYEPGVHVRHLGQTKIMVWPNYSARFLEIPFWLILAVLLPPWWLMGRKSRQRKRWDKEGRCMSCGYNLRGSESGTCSECGAGYGQVKA